MMETSLWITTMPNRQSVRSPSAERTSSSSNPTGAQKQVPFYIASLRQPKQIILTPTNTSSCFFQKYQSTWKIQILSSSTISCPGLHASSTNVPALLNSLNCFKVQLNLSNIKIPAEMRGFFTLWYSWLRAYS